MNSEELLKEYKKLPDDIKGHLNEMDAYYECYQRDKNISDEMVIFITSLARECWLDDEYSKADIASYANYILDGIYKYNATKEELEDLYSKDIVESYNQDDDFEDLLKFDTDEYQYCFSTSDGNKYYCEKGEDGFYIVNGDDRCIKKPNPMDSDYETIFSLLDENKITDLPLSMHYNIRCIIKENILPDDELSEEYKNGIENYKKYCEDRFITSEDILRATNLENDISLTNIDNFYTKINKMERLSKYFHNIDRNGNSYLYVASLNNGTDYYYKKGKYLALDKNNVVKEFEETPRFMLNELNNKYKFAYLSDDELSKISKEIEDDYNDLRRPKKDNVFNDRTGYKLDKFMEYVSDKELKPSFSTDTVNMTIILHQAIHKAHKEMMKERREDLSKRIKMGKEHSKMMKETEKEL